MLESKRREGSMKGFMFRLKKKKKYFDSCTYRSVQRSS